MNGVELFTKSITIMVHLDGYDNEDFDIAIEDGINETKVLTLTAHDVKRLSIDKNTCKLDYMGMNLFSIDNLSITCKYPVVVRYNDVVFSKCIEPVTTK